MKSLLVSIAAVAALTAAAPAVAKNGNGNGSHKAQKQQQKQARGSEQGSLYNAFGQQRFGQNTRGCPPGLAKKNNGCLPPGQAKKRGVGERLPSYLSRYNVPVQYQDRYYDNNDYSYRYENDNIYRVNRSSGIIEDIISVLGL